MNLTYVGKLPIETEGGGVKPKVFDIDWNSHPTMVGGSIEALASTGSFGTFLYCRSQAVDDGDIEIGWTKVFSKVEQLLHINNLYGSKLIAVILSSIQKILSEIPGKFCKWNPQYGQILAVGCVTENNIGEIYMIDTVKNQCNRVFQVKNFTSFIYDRFVHTNNVTNFLVRCR